MAETDMPQDQAPPTLDQEVTSEGLVHEAPHVTPKAFGIDASGWASLAMIVVILIFLWKKVPALIGGALDKKIGAIKHQLDEAKSLRAEAEALRAEYDRKAKAAADDAEAMRVRAEEEARAIIAKAEVDAADLVARRTRMAEEKIAAAENAVIAELRMRTAALAADGAATLIAKHNIAAHDRALVDGVIDGVGRHH